MTSSINKSNFKISKKEKKKKGYVLCIGRVVLGLTVLLGNVMCLGFTRWTEILGQRPRAKSVK